MRAEITIAGLCVLPLLASSASAQNEERYRLERTDDGYVRMDTQTGTMTLCRERESELVCQPASEELQEAPSDMDLLRERVEELEERVEALEGGDSAVPLEEEFEQTLTLMERFFRRFIDIVRGLEEEEQQAPEPAPTDRT